MNGNDSQPRVVESLGLPDQVGDTIDDAIDIAVHSTGRVGFIQTLENGDDVDVFRLPNALPGTLIVAGIKGIEAELVDENGNVIEAKGATGASEGRTVVKTYGQNGLGENPDSFVYLRVSSSLGFAGRYQVNVSLDGEMPELPSDFVPFDVLAADHRPDSALGDDLHGETIQSATRYSNDDNPSRTSFIDQPGDVDVFRFKGLGAMVTFSVHSDDIDSLRLRAFGEDGVELPYALTREDEGRYGISINNWDAPDFLDSQGNTRHAFYVEVSAADNATGQYTFMRGSKGFIGFTMQNALDAPREAFVIPQLAKQIRAEDNQIIGFDDHSGELAGATLIDLNPIEHTESSFLDGPADRDAFTFTAEYTDVLLTFHRNTQDLAARGVGTFDVYDSSGELVTPNSEQEDEFEGYLSRYMRKAYDLTVGDAYTVVAYNEAENGYGRYSLQFENQGDVLSTLDVSQARELTFPAGRESTVNVAGQIDGVDEVDMYRFSTNAVAAIAGINTLGPFQTRLFDAETGLPIVSPFNHFNGDLLYSLDSATDNVTRDYLFAVWNHDTTGQYDLEIILKQPVVEVEDTVGDTIAEATLVTQEDRESSFSTWRSASMNVHLNSADDVDVFSFVAERTMTGISASVMDHYRDAKYRGLVQVQVFDAAGNEVATDPFSSQFETDAILVRLRVSTTPGEIYHVRFSQLSPNPLALRVSIH